MVASDDILKQVTLMRRDSVELCVIAISRMTGSTCSRSQLRPFPGVTLDEIGQDDTTLFVVEKQNLYIDEKREASRWAQVLQELSTRAVGQDQAKALIDWVINGLEVFLEKAELMEGALGWCSNPDAFVLFWRVLCGAEVLMSWRLRTKKVDVKGSEIRHLIISLLSVGRKTDLHEQVLEKLEMILTGAIKKRTILLGNKMRELENGLMGH
jgi:hypothetical protein